MKPQRQTPSFNNLTPASEAASRAKKAIRSRDTKPELALRRALWRLGLRYRVVNRNLPGKPDISFPTERVAIFCDGDFWHGRNWALRRAKLARGANAEYWIKKIESNRVRDRRVTVELQEAGWTVLRFWELDVMRDVESHAALVQRTVLRRRVDVTRTSDK